MLPFGHVILEVTEACPHACLHCYNFWRDERASLAAADTLTKDEILALIRLILKETRLRNVGISGGEPLLRRDLPAIVAGLQAEQLDVTVITSGALLTPARAAQFLPQTAFEITLFSADASLHDRIAGRDGAFRRVVNGAVALWERGCPLAISVVVNALNAHDVGRALELGAALGGRGFLLNRMNLSRISWSRARDLAPRPEHLKQALDAAEAFAVRCGTMVSVSVPIPPCVADLRPYKHLFFGWCARGGPDAYYTISHNGLLRPCNHSSRILGDLRRESFSDIVRRRQTAAFWRPIPKQCQTCEFPDHRLCRGGCPAASDECFGTRSRRDPLLEIALEPGEATVKPALPALSASC